MPVHQSGRSVAETLGLGRRVVQTLQGPWAAVTCMMHQFVQISMSQQSGLFKFSPIPAYTRVSGPVWH